MSPLSRGPAWAQGRGGWGPGTAPLAGSAQTFRLRRWNARGRLLVALGVVPTLAAAGRGGADPGRGTFKSAARAPRLTERVNTRRRTPWRAASRDCSCCSGRCCCRLPPRPLPTSAPRPARPPGGWGPSAPGAAQGAVRLLPPPPARPTPGPASPAGPAAQVRPGRGGRGAPGRDVLQGAEREEWVGWGPRHRCAASIPAGAIAVREEKIPSPMNPMGRLRSREGREMLKVTPGQG